MIRTGLQFNRATVMVALFFFAVLPGCGPAVEAPSKSSRETLVIETAEGARSFSIEVARTPEQKARGLMFRTSLESGEGMLFVHERAQTVSMWMRNTYIALDMIFIGADGRVSSIAARTEPHSEAIVSSNGAVTGVLEIGGGEADRLGIAEGDVVRHGHFESASGK